MATTGKVPLLGFKAAAIKFVALFGFSPSSDSAGSASPRTVDLTGSYVPALDITGSYATAIMGGSYVPTIDLEGSVGD